MFRRFNRYKFLRTTIMIVLSLVVMISFAFPISVTAAAVPTVTTSPATNVSSTGATLAGTLGSLGSSSSVSVRFELGTTTNYGITTAYQTLTYTGNFSANVTGLAPNTTYHFLVAVVSSTGTIWSADRTFTTSSTSTTSTVPTVTTSPATNVSSTGATLAGTLGSLGSSSSVSVRFELGTTTNYGITTAYQTLTYTGNFSANVTGLAPNTTYHFLVAVVSSTGTIWSADRTFTTSSTSTTSTVPTVTTSPATNVSSTGATLAGTLGSLGSSSSVSVRFELGTTTNYGITTAYQTLTYTGNFSANVTGLAPNTTYHFLVAVVSSTGTIWSADRTFTTSSTTPSTTTNYRVVAYITAEGVYQSIDYTKITHLIYNGPIFVTSATNATLVDGGHGIPFSALSKIRTAAKAANPNIKYLADIAGGEWNSYDRGNLNNILANSALRSQLVRNIVSLVSTQSLDGVDIDWEGYTEIKANYAAFLSELRYNLPAGKLISVTGCAAQTYHNWFSPATVNSYVDMVNIMMFDISKPTLASLPDTTTYLNMWLNNGFAASKLNLGIPLYAADNWQVMLASYGQVIAQLNPAISSNQQWVSTINGFAGNYLTVNGGLLWWNGVELAISKVQLIKSKSLGGVMLFRVDDDAVGNAKSLLTNIARALNP